jgi:hypothetical protein
MNLRRDLAWAGMLAACCALGAVEGRAVPFLHGQSLPLPGVSLASAPQLNGTVVEDETFPFSFVGDDAGGLIAGTLRQQVVRSTVDGTLDFYWIVTNDPASSGPIGLVRIGQFPSEPINADWLTDGAGDVAPGAGLRFSGGLSAFFNFTFSAGQVLPGQSSYPLLIDTAAKTYAKTAIVDVATLASSYSSDVAAAFAPIVPEPATGAWGLAVACVAAVGDRRRARG